MRLFGLIGYPLSHSFSKHYFTEKFRKEGIEDCRYDLFPIQEISALPQLLQLHPDLEGLNVTIPYKKDVLGYLSDKSRLPKGLSACNCIKIKNGDLIGFNTDVIGFEKSIAPLLTSSHNRALILGTGGVSVAIHYALANKGIDCQLVSRTVGAEGVLSYADITEKVVQTHLLIINATPAGMYPNIHECPPLPYEQLTPAHLLYDVVYNPEKSLFLTKGEEQGAAVKNGEEMLLIQAEESWRIWNES